MKKKYKNVCNFFFQTQLIYCHFWAQILKITFSMLLVQVLKDKDCAEQLPFFIRRNDDQCSCNRKFSNYSTVKVTYVTTDLWKKKKTKKLLIKKMSQTLQVSLLLGGCRGGDLFSMDGCDMLLISWWTLHFVCFWTQAGHYIWLEIIISILLVF